MKNNVLTQTDLSLPVFIKGKVRDTYRLGEYLLIIATDRISAFDVILNEGIPFKGAVLNQISSYWFNKTADIIRNHIIEIIVSDSQLDKYFSTSEKAFIQQPTPRKSHGSQEGLKDCLLNVSSAVILRARQ